MPGPVTPFHSGRRSTRLSQYVDDSLPVELMLRAGLAKQKQQDEMVALLDTAKQWKMDTLEGGDTELKKQIQESIKKFGDEYTMKNLTTAENQRTVKDFLTKFNTDERIDQAEKNYKKKIAMEATIAKMKATKNPAFGPSIRKAERELQGYINSGKMGEQFGSLDIEAALNLQAHKQTYFDQLKADGDEDLIRNIAGLKGILGKRGYLGIKDERIEEVAERMASEYEKTPEGQQDLALYHEAKLNGTLSDPNLTPRQYLAESLLKTGAEFAFDRNTVSAQMNLNKSKGSGDEEERERVILESGITQSTSDNPLDIENLEKTAREGGANLNEQREAQSDLDKINNWRKNTPTGIGIVENVKKLTTPDPNDPTNVYNQLPVLSSENILNTAKNVEVENTTGMSNDMVEGFTEQVNSVLDIVSPKLAEMMPGIIDKEINQNKNLNFAKYLADGTVFQQTVKRDKNGIPLYKDGKAIPGVQINGVRGKEANGSTFYSYEELGVGDTEEGQKFIDSFSLSPEKLKKYTGEDGTFLGNQRAGSEIMNNPEVLVRNTYATKRMDNGLRAAGKMYHADGGIKSDAADKIVESLEQWDKLGEEQEGMAVKTPGTIRFEQKKPNDAVKEILKTMSPTNYEAVNVHGIKLPNSDEVVAETLTLANQANPGFTMRPMVGMRGIEITKKVAATGGNPSGNVTYVIKEAKGVGGERIPQQSFSRIYQILGTAAGHPNLGSEAGAADNLDAFTQNTPQNIENVIKPQYRNAWPFVENNKYTVALNPNDIQTSKTTRKVRKAFGPGYKDEEITSYSYGQYPYVLGDKHGTFTTKDLIDKLGKQIEADPDNTKRNANLQAAQQALFSKMAERMGSSTEEALEAAKYELTGDSNVLEELTEDEAEKIAQDVMARGYGATNLFDLIKIATIMNFTPEADNR